ncbi:titin homolog [Helianthus annuus]|uniref:titin homolog n=1 Tax=Helianthus annuus TaxID=4232 RepID=UPI000B9070D8|nr:titin homolog [Helianthus annuus]
MKEASYAEELKTLANFKETQNEWFVKEEKKKRSRKATPKVQVEEGLSSQPKQKRQKKSVETMLVDESDKEDEAEDDAEGDQVCLSPESARFLKSLNEYNAETEKAAGDEGDDVEESSSSSSDEEIDETERVKRIRDEVEKEKQLKRKRREDKDDELYNPSPEHVTESQTSPSSGGRKKASARKRVISPKAARRKLIVKLPKRTSKPKPPTPPKQPTPPQSPPPQTEQQLSPPHLSPPHQTPIQEQPVITLLQIFQTPPTTRPPIQTTPGSSGYKDFPHIPVNIPLDDIGYFSFVNDEQVKKLEKKVEEVLVENKKLVDREKKLEKRFKSVEAENSSLLKKVEADQLEIDFMKVKIAELEDEKAHRDEQNKYFRLKNKELEAANAKKEHEMYMINKVLENLLGKSVKKKFEEIEVEEVRARRQAAIDAEMKNKGKGVEGTSEVTERAIVSSAVSEEDDDEDKTDDADDIFSASSHSDNDNDDDGQGGTGIKVTTASNEENVDDYLRDDANEEPENAEGEGENVDDQNVESERLILRLEPDVEEGEIRHTYTMDDFIKMTHIDDPNFNQANIDELRRKVEECLKDKNLNGTTKDESREERKKWFRKDTERKFKRPLKFYKRDRDVSLGDIISWSFLTQDIMSLPWWDVEELSKVTTLDYPVRKHDVLIWGLMKFEAFRGFKHWKPHYPKKVKRVDPVSGIEETILHEKKPKVINNIPVPKMEQDFHKGFVY